MAEDVTLFEHLHKLVVVKSEQEIENLLQLLWLTRKTGLSASQKSSVQSLLNLPSPGDLHPVLVSIRSLIRNCVHRDLEGDDALKLLLPGLPLELDSMLCILLQKHKTHWKEEPSQEQHVTGQPQLLDQVNLGLSAPLLPSPSWGISGSLLSLQVDPIPHFNGQNLAITTPITCDRNAVCFPQSSTLQNDVVPQEIPGVLPRVKSMTWTVENRSEMPNHRVAIITLKLHDYTKSPSTEMEVKFQLTRDTLEAVLRSMAYINNQLSQFFYQPYIKMASSVFLLEYFVFLLVFPLETVPTFDFKDFYKRLVPRLDPLHYHYRRNKDYDYDRAMEAYR